MKTFTGSLDVVIEAEDEKEAARIFAGWLSDPEQGWGIRLRDEATGESWLFDTDSPSHFEEEDEDESEPDNDAQSLEERYGGHWGEHPEYPREDWQRQVEDGDTGLGYWEWVENELRYADEDEEEED